VHLAKVFYFGIKALLYKQRRSMAISRAKKEEIVANVSDLLDGARMTVVMDYRGLTVKQMQELRRNAKEQDVSITVAKNRLVKLALSQNDSLKTVDTTVFTGQIGLAFGNSDEVAPAQVLANFAKDNPSLELLAAFNADGEEFDASQVAELAKLPSKDVLRGQVVGTIAAPLSGFVNVMQGNIRGLVQVLNAHRQVIES